MHDKFRMDGTLLNSHIYKPYILYVLGSFFSRIRISIVYPHETSPMQLLLSVPTSAPPWHLLVYWILLTSLAAIKPKNKSMDCALSLQSKLVNLCRPPCLWYIKALQGQVLTGMKVDVQWGHIPLRHKDLLVSKEPEQTVKLARRDA